MTGDQARALLAAPVRFERRSVYWSCSVCGSMISDSDRAAHRAAHRALVALLIGNGGHPDGEDGS